MANIKKEYLISLAAIIVILSALYFVFQPKDDQIIHASIGLSQYADGNRIEDITLNQLQEKINTNEDLYAYIEHPDCYDIKEINESIIQYQFLKKIYVVDLSREANISIVNNNSCKYLISPLYVNDLSIYSMPTIIHFKDTKMIERYNLSEEADAIHILMDLGILKELSN